MAATVFEGMTVSVAYSIIIPSCVLGLLYAFFNFIMVRRVNIESAGSNDQQLLEDKQKNQMIA